MLYEALKLVHILLATVAVGGNLSYGFWIMTASGSSHVLPHVLRRIRDFDQYIANPSYGLLLLTGLALVWTGGWLWTTTWIVLGLGLWILVAAIGTGLFLPSLKRQIDALDRFGAHSQAYRRCSRQTTRAGVITMVLVLLILAVMVLKPDGWF